MSAAHQAATLRRGARVLRAAYRAAIAGAAVLLAIELTIHVPALCERFLP